MPSSPAKARTGGSRPVAAPKRISHAGTVALVGRPNVGKSTLLNALLGERLAITSHQPQTTRDRILGILTSYEASAQLALLDTPGIHAPRTELGKRMNAIADSTAKDADVVIFMTDVPTTPKAEVSTEDLAILRQIPEGKPLVVVVNKVDKVQPKELLFPFLEALGKARDADAVVPIAALKGKGVDRVVKEVARLLPEGEPLYDEEELSDKPVRFFVAEMVREQILKLTRQEVPHGVAVIVDAYDDGPKRVRVAVTIHVAKDAHKAILIGQRGAMLSAIGSAARKRAERFLGKPVHLETFVRATPKWFDDPAQLRELGYAEDAPKKKQKKR